MVVSHNLLALNAQRQLNITNAKKNKTMEKLSSGYRINRAADDAAGLSISEKMRKQIRGLTQGVNNTQDGISMCQVADGALHEVSDMLHRISELSVKATNGTNSYSDREAIQEEINELLTEIDRVSLTTTFNDQRIFGPPIDKNYLAPDERARQDLLNGMVVSFDEDVISSDGTVIPKEAANFAVRLLSNIAILDGAQKMYDKYGPNPYDSRLKVSEVEDYMWKKMQKIMDNTHPLYDDGNSNLYTRHMLYAEENTEKAIAAHAQNNNSYNDGYEHWIDRNMGGEYIDALSYARANLTTDYICLAEGLFYADSLLTNHSKTSLVKYDDQIRTAMGNFSNAMFYRLRSEHVSTGSFYDSVQDATITDRSYFKKEVDATEWAVEQYMKLVKYDEEEKEEEKNKEIWIQSGAEAGDGMYISFKKVDTEALGIKGAKVMSESQAGETIDKVTYALKYLSETRSQIGAQQNRLEHTILNEENVIENTTAAESAIRDTNMATEMVKYSTLQILQQAGEAMLTQANQSQNGVLSLLR